MNPRHELDDQDPYVAEIAAAPAQDEVGYLQELLDRAHEEIAEYRRGIAADIRQPLLMELIVVAHAIESYLANDSTRLSADDYRNFLKAGVLGDLHQALLRYEVEPFVTSTQGINRRCQKVERIEETDDPQLDGQVHPLTRGFAIGDRVLHKEHVILYRLRGGS